jgi:hypothetical protein
MERHKRRRPVLTPSKSTPPASHNQSKTQLSRPRVIQIRPKGRAKAERVRNRRFEGFSEAVSEFLEECDYNDKDGI